MKIIFSALVVLLLVAGGNAVSNLSCKNHDGQQVDWWIMLKMPKQFNEGREYLYFDAETQSKQFEHYNNLNDANSPLFQTIQQIKDVTSSQYTSVFWNDQPYTEKSVSSSYAHSKGILGGNSKTGFVINHSIPKFVNINNKDQIDMEVPSNQSIYGQHIFCVSVDATTLNKYVQALIVDRVWIAAKANLPSSLESTYPNIIDLLNNKHRVNEEDFVAIDFKSVGGESFTRFAKNYKSQMDIYAQVVAPHYKSDFVIESWGRPLQDADCSSKYNSVSNLSIEFSKDISYSYTNDHSKYGYAINAEVICFGDVNRMNSQFKRGGGTTCFKNSSVYGFISRSLTQQQSCGKLKLRKSQPEEEIDILGYIKSFFV